MNQPHLKRADHPSIPVGFKSSADGVGLNGIEQAAEQIDWPDEFGPTLANGVGGVSAGRRDLEGTCDEFDHAVPIEPGDCLGHIARARARYQKNHPECEADYRAAFLLDAGLTAREIIRGLEVDIRDDVAYHLMNCRKLLNIDSQDLVARVWLGLTLLVLYQDAAGYCELQQVFLQNPVWRPFLRLLVNEVKLQRGSILAQMFICP
jgi:hypothetical protein